jgi:hypothetical protein
MGAVCLVTHRHEEFRQPRFRLLSRQCWSQCHLARIGRWQSLSQLYTAHIAWEKMHSVLRSNILFYSNAEAAACKPHTSHLVLSSLMSARSPKISPSCHQQDIMYMQTVGCGTFDTCKLLLGVIDDENVTKIIPVHSCVPVDQQPYDSVSHLMPSTVICKRARYA